MPRHAKTMSIPERLACGDQAAAGKTDAQIAQASGWSIWTIRKWRRAAQQSDPAGLAPQMGRPRTGALSAFPSTISQQVERLRREHPGWGPITLLTELPRTVACAEMALPSRARIAAFLNEHQLVRPYERHGGILPSATQTASQVHEEWEMDAQGAQVVPGLGKVSVIDILDVVSLLKVASYPHLWGSGLGWQDYQLVLRWAFFHWGMPIRISLDHESAFFDNTSSSPYPSRLHLWLIALGVEVVFIEKPPPLQHAHIERHHQTMTAQTLTGQTWRDQPGLWQGLDARREFLNTRYPSRALHYHAPLDAFPQAMHSGREYRPEWEAELLDLPRLYAWLSQGRWFRVTNLHGEFWLGMQRYNAGGTQANTPLEIHFDPVRVEFVVHPVGSDQIRHFPAKGLSKPDLMGELPPEARMPAYQLYLPFSREVWRSNILVQGSTGMTL